MGFGSWTRVKPKKQNHSQGLSVVCDKKSKKWRRLRVVFPPSLYHYTHHIITPPHPQNTQTLITHSLPLSLSISPFIYIHKRSVLLYLHYIVFCHYPFLSLFSILHLPFIISQGFRPFLSCADRCYLNFGPFH